MKQNIFGFSQILLLLLLTNLPHEIAADSSQRVIAQHRTNSTSTRVIYFSTTLRPDTVPNNIVDVERSKGFCGRDIYEQADYNRKVMHSLEICCDMVDKCGDSIAPGKTKYGLYNPYSSKIVKCECDSRFFACLKDADRLHNHHHRAFKHAQRSYFITNSRKCLQKLYSPYCDGLWYDRKGKTYDDNSRGYYFCPKLISSIMTP